jgi:hypothetical protein
MTHTVESLMALAEEWASLEGAAPDSTQSLYGDIEAAKSKLHAALTEALQPKVGPSRKDIQTAVLRGLSAWGESIGGHTLDFVVDEVMRLYAAPPQPKEPT